CRHHEMEAEKMKKNYILTLLSLVVLLLAACTGNNPGTNDNTNDSGNDIVQNDSDNNTGNGDGETNQDDNNSDENSGSTQNEENSSSLEGAMTPVEAYDRYVEEYPNTKVGKVHLDKSKNMYVYKIEG